MAFPCYEDYFDSGENLIFPPKTSERWTTRLDYLIEATCAGLACHRRTCRATVPFGGLRGTALEKTMQETHTEEGDLSLSFLKLHQVDSRWWGLTLARTTADDFSHLMQALDIMAGEHKLCRGIEDTIKAERIQEILDILKHQRGRQSCSRHSETESSSVMTAPRSSVTPMSDSDLWPPPKLDVCQDFSPTLGPPPCKRRIIRLVRRAPST